MRPDTASPQLPAGLRCYRVGGAVRDHLLGYPFTETDWVVVGGTAQAMLDTGFKPVGKDFPVFLHPQTGEEYALARTERKSGRGYHGFEVHAHPDVSLEDDLLRRDLTINAMAMDEDGAIIDPYGGQRDLEERRLRHVSPAFAEDPLRVLRVARFAARYHHLGFQVADDTLALMRELSRSGELRELARERLWQELAKGLAEASPQILFRVLLDCEALQHLVPAWAEALNDDVLATLQRAGENKLGLEERFAISCLKLASADLDTVCEAIAAPKSPRQLAGLLLQVTPLPIAPSDAEQLLAILERCDALRKPERLQQVIAIEQLRGSGDYTLYRDAAAVIKTVRAEPLQKQGLSGKALGEALRKQRLQQLEQLL